MFLLCAGVGCGPGSIASGGSGFGSATGTETGAEATTAPPGSGSGSGPSTDTDTESGSESESDDETETDSETETETETGEPECPEKVNTGNVSIGSVEELYELEGVTKIDGNFEFVGEWGELEEGLEPLRCLDEITGFFYVHDTDLASFSGLDRLRRIGGYFFIGSTFNLQTFEGLGALRQIGSYLSIGENFGLVSTAGTDLLVVRLLVVLSVVRRLVHHFDREAVLSPRRVVQTENHLLDVWLSELISQCGERCGEGLR